MINLLRKKFAEAMAVMNVSYILKLERSYMDAIQEILPFVYALTLRVAFDAKVINHNLELDRRQNFLLLLHLICEEINGHRMSNNFVDV